MSLHQLFNPASHHEQIMVAVFVLAAVITVLALFVARPRTYKPKQEAFWLPGDYDERL